MLSMPVFAGTVMAVAKGVELSSSTMVIGVVLLPVCVGEVTVAEAGDVIPAVRPRASASTAPDASAREPWRGRAWDTGKILRVGAGTIDRPSTGVVRWIPRLP
jgi:hypothetical protein